MGKAFDKVYWKFLFPAMNKVELNLKERHLILNLCKFQSREIEVNVCRRASLLSPDFVHDGNNERENKRRQD